MSLSKIFDWAYRLEGRATIIALSVVAIVGVWLQMQDQSYRNHAAAEYQAGEQQRESDTLTLRTQNHASPYELEYHSAEKEEVPDRFAWRTPEEWIAILTAVLAFSTLGLWVFTALLWSTTVRAIRQASVDADKTRQAMLIAQRPRLRFWEVVMDIKAGAALSGKLLVQNTGVTPAKLLNARGGNCIGVFCHVGPLPQKNPIDEYLGQNLPDAEMLAGASIFWWEFRGPTLDRAAVERIKQFETTLYVIGRLMFEFEGVTGPIKQHALLAFAYDPMTNRFTAIDDPDYAT